MRCARKARSSRLGPAPNDVQTDFFKLVTQGGPIAQTVLVMLLIFSAVSWGVILYKFWQFARAGAADVHVLDIFRKSSKFSEVQAVCRTLPDEPARRPVPGGVRGTQLAAAQAGNPESQASRPPRLVQP